MPNVLEVQIIGDVSGLEKSLKQAESLQAEYTASIEKTSKELSDNIAITRNYAKAIDDLNKEYKSGAISSKEYSSQLANLKRDEKESTVVTADLRKELSNLKKEQKELGGSFDSATPKIANGGNALMQFSRIAQDAPFGIMGIGNNITATVEAFGHLQKSAGGTGAALKAVAGSIVGSGGILLAVSLVTTGLTYMAQNGITVGDVFNKISGDFDQARASMQELNVEAVKGSAEQIASMNAYVSVASNVNLSMSDRLIAVKKLQSEYPAYFGNLTQEQILNGNVANAVRGATRALIEKAKAAAAVDKVVKLAEEEESIQGKINNTIAAQARFYKLTKKEAFDAAVILNKQLRGEIDLEAELAAGRANSLSKAEKTALAAFEYSQTLQGLGKELQTNINQQEKYTASINKSTAAQIKLETEAPKAVKAKKTKAPNITPQVTGLDTQLTANDLVDVNSIAVVTGKLDEFGNKIEGFATDLVIPQFKIRPVETADFIASLERAKATSKVFSDAVGASIGSLASQMTSSLQTGNAVLDSFVGSVIGSLAQIAQAQITGLIADQAIATAKIGTNQAVATSSAVAGASQTAAASGPAAAFLLPALVGAAIGFIAASFAGIKFAHGGVVPGGSYTGDKIPAMLNSGETVLNQQQQANTLMAIANGNSNSLQGNRSEDSFHISTVLRGSDILLSIERQKKKR